MNTPHKRTMQRGMRNRKIYQDTCESKEIDQYPVPVIINISKRHGRSRPHFVSLESIFARSSQYHFTDRIPGPGTRGDRLLRGEPRIKIHGEMIPVRAQSPS